FDKSYAVGDSEAREIVARLRNEYERAYYSGIICERRAKAYLHRGSGGSGVNAYEKLRKPCTITSGPKLCVHPEMMTLCCAGTPARESSFRIGSGRALRKRSSRRWNEVGGFPESLAGVFHGRGRARTPLRAGDTPAARRMTIDESLPF